MYDLQRLQKRSKTFRGRLIQKCFQLKTSAFHYFSCLFSFGCLGENPKFECKAIEKKNFPNLKEMPQFSRSVSLRTRAELKFKIDKKDVWKHVADPTESR